MPTRKTHPPSQLTQRPGRRVVVTDANSCVASDSVTVTVNSPVNAGGDGSTTVGNQYYPSR
ncbi:MAG: hypothetical protein IPN38_20195 [Flavobacteriales bacterium]|nr:hypothetical protein [Flavobacteriales bacterium]